MKCLVTAGNTQAMIDQVRCITNIFSGRTGARIALELHHRGHDVVLLTSSPDLPELISIPTSDPRWKVIPYRSYQDLANLMQYEVTNGIYHAIIHSAAVSDYLSEGVYSPAANTTFDPSTAQWQASKGKPALADVSAGKVKSSHNELWLRLVKAPKLIDQVRTNWNYQGKLVKFKLEVGVDQPQLEVIAEVSRTQSAADWIVANTLEGMNDWALLGPVRGQYFSVKRSELASRLVDLLELNNAN